MRKICVVFGFILFASGVFAQAGFTWTSSIVPAYRHVNAANCLAYDKICAVGGNENNDSITCIFLTENGGTNWTLISDTMGPWIKDQHFVNSITGFACGDDGLILKTTNGGTNWNRKMLSGNMQSRAFNGIFFIDENIGIAVGGNEWNDAITTIIRTTDGGQSWNLVMDNLGPWLRDVYFVNSTTGFAVGDNGLLLKTTDGGLNWTTLTVTGSAANRKYNAVWFTDANTGVAVGGNQSNDSIATIIRTTDGGATWNMLQDAIAPWLTDVTFISSTRGYIVGRNGTFLKTDNAGATWTVDSIPGTDANYSFNSISFLNYQYGVVGGQNGRVFIASSGSGQSPVGNTLPASTVWETFATLNAFVKPYGNDVQVYLEYGQGASFSHSIYIGNFSGTDSIPLSTNITGLAANTIYNCRLKLTSSWGTFYGDAVQFFPSNGVVPNWGFEHWTQKAWESPSGYNFVQGNVSKTTSYNSSSAVRLETEFEAGEAIPGVVGMIMVTGNAQFGPYTPFAARPDSIIAFMNYDIPSGDSAMLLCMFFEAGTPLSMDMILIGGSSGGFVRRSFPVSYNSPNTPDSIGIAFVNSNPFLQGPLAQYGWLEIDDISFSGTSENIPNNDFELWRNDTIYRPESWYYQTRDDHSALIMGEDLTIT
ncbi:MAG: hypothetical protein KKA07_07340, partial [Bacteroidetes bacterium]|nr:hypothetical protein [Bacteroidota bacterium]